MKTKQLIMATLLTVMSAAAGATDDDKPVASAKVNVIAGEGDVYHVLVRGDVDANVTINIRNEENKLVFTETIRKLHTFRRPYNLEKLPRGVYTIEVVDEDTTTVTIYHKIDEELGYVETATPAPAFIKMDSLAGREVYKLTIVKRGKKKASITIYNDRKEVLYSAVEPFENAFCKLYNLKGVGEHALVEVEIDGEITRYAL